MCMEVMDWYYELHYLMNLQVDSSTFVAYILTGRETCFQTVRSYAKNSNCIDISVRPYVRNTCNPPQKLNWNKNNAAYWK